MTTPDNWSADADLRTAIHEALDARFYLGLAGFGFSEHFGDRYEEFRAADEAAVERLFALLSGVGVEALRAVAA